MEKRLLCLLAVLMLCPAIAGCRSTPSNPESDSPGPSQPQSAPDSSALVPITTGNEEALALYLEARTLAERFHTEEARPKLMTAVDLDPGFVTAWLLLSTIAPGRDLRETCLARAEQGAPAVSEAERLAVHAAIAGGAGRLELAREHLTEITTLFPADPRAHFQLAMNYWASDDPAALTSLERAVELDPRLDVAWNMLGYAQAHFGNIDAAVKAHRMYVSLLPDEPNANDSLAETLLRAGRYEESIARYRMALDLDPTFVWSRMGIGHNQVFLKRYTLAHAAYERAMAEAGTPEFVATANQWLIALGVYSGVASDAIGAAERGITLSTGLGDFEAAMAVRTLARVHLFAGNTALARRFAGQALARIGEDAPPSARRDVTHSVLRLLAEIDLAENDVDSATRRVEELADLSETIWEVRLTAFTEGLVALRRGDSAAALEAFQRAPLGGDPRFLYYLAEAHLAEGNRAEAAKLYSRVVEFNAPSLGHALVYSAARARAAILSYR